MTKRRIETRKQRLRVLIANNTTAQLTDDQK